jgi:hypothetical protein
MLCTWYACRVPQATKLNPIKLTNYWRWGGTKDQQWLWCKGYPNGAHLIHIHIYIQTEDSKAISSHAMKQLGERWYSSYSLLTSALDGVRGQHHTWPCFTPRENGPQYPLDRRRGGPIDGLDTQGPGKILCPCRESNPSHLVHSHTLYQLSYPGHTGYFITTKKQNLTYFYQKSVMNIAMDRNIFAVGSLWSNNFTGRHELVPWTIHRYRMLNGSLFTKEWCILRLWMVQAASRYEV